MILNRPLSKLPNRPSVPTFKEALRLHQAGRNAEAEQIRRAIREHAPDYAEALHLLDAVGHQRGGEEAALRYIGRAIALDITWTAYFNSEMRNLLPQLIIHRT